ncbi:MAG: hypothetical protein HYZ68_06840 [Chloroflexi bacterium]|nr:hypothetical protein [Chloroflexota bacterium]
MWRNAWVLLALGTVASSGAVQGPCAVPVWEISFPSPDAQLQGLVEVRGSACLGGDFSFYKFEYQAAAHPNHWVWVFSGDREVVNGILGFWDTTVADHGDGVYDMVLTVVRRDGNFVQTPLRRVVVANAQPLASPTPQGTTTPTLGPGPPGPGTPTATFVIPVPTAVRIEASPIVIGLPTPNPARGGGLSLPDTGPFLRSFLCGAFLAVAAFGAVGAVGILRKRPGTPEAKTRL